ncbi:MAG: methionyl-tRNA formyltransferase, partial [Pelolinea sp.]|nr:methionyl-tRNA formyltransferase [Pelolinea sp.]
LQSPPVIKFSNKTGIPGLQPNKLSQDGVMNSISDWNPDLIVVAAYGKILGQNILDYPEFGCINVHASLLPSWRGASPIQSAILSGDPKTGVTIMKMDAGIDTGEILTQREIQISDSDTTATLSKKLAEIGAELLINTLPEYFSGKIILKEQDEIRASHTQLIKKIDGILNFQKSAEELERQIQAYNPWPISFFRWNGKSIKVYKAKVLRSNILPSGKKGVIDKYPSVGTGNRDLQLLELQMPGKQIIDGKAFLNGARNWSD